MSSVKTFQACKKLPYQVTMLAYKGNVMRVFMILLLTASAFPEGLMNTF
jgi:hypothetical protein